MSRPILRAKLDKWTEIEFLLHLLNGPVCLGHSGPLYFSLRKRLKELGL